MTEVLVLVIWDLVNSNFFLNERGDCFKPFIRIQGQVNEQVSAFPSLQATTEEPVRSDAATTSAAGVDNAGQSAIQPMGQPAVSANEGAECLEISSERRLTVVDELMKGCF